jgi:hypothetical protein
LLVGFFFFSLGVCVLFVEGGGYLSSLLSSPLLSFIFFGQLIFYIFLLVIKDVHFEVVAQSLAKKIPFTFSEFALFAPFFFTILLVVV